MTAAIWGFEAKCTYEVVKYGREPTSFPAGSGILKNCENSAGHNSTQVQWLLTTLEDFQKNQDPANGQRWLRPDSPVARMDDGGWWTLWPDKYENF
jgi:hypothetical protein